VKRQKD
jgi:hypothetical protein